MKKDKTISTTEKNYYKHDLKKQTSPEVDKMQEVFIDEKTKLYIAPNASAEEARQRYFDKMRAKR